MVALIIALLEDAEHDVAVRDCLMEAGHDVCVVDSFAKAIAFLQQQSVDLILSDVHLENGGSVFDFLKWVKKQPLLYTIPFVLLSLGPTKLAKYLADGVQISARQLGAAKYISMDRFDPLLLREEIANLLPEGSSVQITVKKEQVQT